MNFCGGLSNGFSIVLPDQLYGLSQREIAGIVSVVSRTIKVLGIVGSVTIPINMSVSEHLGGVTLYGKGEKTMPNTREKLIELLERAKNNWKLSTMIPVGCTFESWIADHLIANGVTIQTKKEKHPTDLTGKCGSCVYATPQSEYFSKCYIFCSNKEKQFATKTAPFKLRTNRACKRYEPKGE